MNLSTFSAPWLGTATPAKGREASTLEATTVDRMTSTPTRTTDEILTELAAAQERINECYDIMEQRALLIAEARSQNPPVTWQALGRLLGMSPQGVAKIAATSHSNKASPKSL